MMFWYMFWVYILVILLYVHMYMDVNTSMRYVIVMYLGGVIWGTKGGTQGNNVIWDGP